jgi:hypothetical protein
MDSSAPADGGGSEQGRAGDGESRHLPAVEDDEQGMVAMSTRWREWGGREGRRWIR